MIGVSPGEPGRHGSRIDVPQVPAARSATTPAWNGSNRTRVVIVEPTKEELMYLKPAIIAASTLFAVSAFAQGATKYAPGQQPDRRGPGHSESAPGHQKNTNAGPGHSESAPGQKMHKRNTGLGSGGGTRR